MDKRRSEGRINFKQKVGEAVSSRVARREIVISGHTTVAKAILV